MMSDLWTLIKFEYKKIFQKKSSWIALIVVYLFILLGGVLMEIGSIESIWMRIFLPKRRRHIRIYQ